MLARRVSVQELVGVTVIEVSGELDLIGGFDLRQAFTAAMQATRETVTLDLSSVSAFDDQGVAALAWCSAQCPTRAHVVRVQPPLRPRAAGARSSPGRSADPR